MMSRVLISRLLPHVARVTLNRSEVTRGMVAVGGGLFRLASRIRSGVALEMIATDEVIDAEAGFIHGLVDHLVDAGKPLIVR